jgi:hypothetical protein
MALLEVLMMASVGLGCPPLANTSVLWSSPARKWLIVGEDHGTQEEPEAFFGIVCQASAKRPVTVAVEQAASEQGAIDTFLASDGGQAARDTFLRSPIWNGAFKDGRSSQAYMLLFERLRQLHKVGRVTSVIAFQPNGEAGPARFEQSMAQQLIKHSPKNSFVIALVGSVHAMRTPVSFGGPAYLPMAGHLPARQTSTLALKGAGGRQWACQSPTDCGPANVFQEGALPDDGLTLTPRKDAPYSAILGIGKPTSASPPQVPSN